MLAFFAYLIDCVQWNIGVHEVGVHLMDLIPNF